MLILENVAKRKEKNHSKLQNTEKTNKLSGGIGTQAPILIRD